MVTTGWGAAIQPQQKYGQGRGINVRTNQHRIMESCHLCFNWGVTITVGQPYPFVYALSLDVFVLG